MVYTSHGSIGNTVGIVDEHDGDDDENGCCYLLNVKLEENLTLENRD